MLALNLRFALLSVFATLTASAGGGESPTDLHTKIDNVISAELTGPAAEVCTDAEFLRRVYLDLAGTIPSVNEARQFFGDAASNKRTALVDQLLQDPRFNRNFMRVFDVMLMERMPEKYINPGSFREFLRASFAQRKGLDQIVREVIVADGAEQQLRPRARFLLERDVQPHVITRDIGRLFLGTDLQCAQCHDHPSIDDYLQSDYYGIYAFLNRSYLYGKDEKIPQIVAEHADGEVAYFSVFVGGDPEEMKPHMPGADQLDEPSMAADNRYVVAPTEGVRPIPKYSRRTRLAQELTSGQYPSFQRNLANRLWAHMLGRGVVHPLDMHHRDNPPVHPELLEVLANGLVDLKFDLRDFVRAIALSRTYQRSSQLPDKLVEYAQSDAAEAAAARIQERRLGLDVEIMSARRQWEFFGEEHKKSSRRLLEVTAARQKLAGGENTKPEEIAKTTGEVAALGLLCDELTRLRRQAELEIERLQRKSVAVDAQLEDVRLLGRFAEIARNNASDDAAKSEALQQLKQRWRDRFACGQVPPLTAEQLTWSISEALGVVDRHRDEAIQKEQQRLKDEKIETADPDKQHERIETAVYTNVGNALYNFIINTHDQRGQPLGEYQATATEPLFLMNSGQVQDWVNGGRKSLVERLEKFSDDTALADELYVSILSRRPDVEEQAIVKLYLTARPEERTATLRDLVWALVTSAEFRFQF